MKFCSVSDCGIPARASGLCHKHYMRIRRHGDPGITKRPGGRYDSTTAIMLEPFREQSPRSRSRFARAIHLAGLMRDYFNVEDALEGAIRHATRKDGSLNFTRLLADLEKRLAVLMASRSGGEGEGGARRTG